MTIKISELPSGSQSDGGTLIINQAGQTRQVDAGDAIFADIGTDQGDLAELNAVGRLPSEVGGIPVAPTSGGLAWSTPTGSTTPGWHPISGGGGGTLAAVLPYNSSTAYAAGQPVLSNADQNADLYVARQASTGQLLSNTTYWTLVGKPVPLASTLAQLRAGTSADTYIAPAVIKPTLDELARFAEELGYGDWSSVSVNKRATLPANANDFFSGTIPLHNHSSIDARTQSVQQGAYAVIGPNCANLPPVNAGNFRFGVIFDSPDTGTKQRWACAVSTSASDRFFSKVVNGAWVWVQGFRDPQIPENWLGLPDDGTWRAINADAIAPPEQAEEFIGRHFGRTIYAVQPHYDALDTAGAFQLRHYNRAQEVELNPDQVRPSNMAATNEPAANQIYQANSATEGTWINTPTGGGGSSLPTQGKADGKALFATGTGANDNAWENIPAPADGSINTAKLADDAVTNPKVADDAIDSAQVADGAIDNVHLSGSISPGKWAATNAPSNGKIYEATGANTGEWVDKPAGGGGSTPADNSVTTPKILDGAVTRPKIAADAVDGSKVADGAIDTEHLAANAVEAAKIAAGAVGTAALAADAVNASKIADDAVGGDQIADASVSGKHLAAGTATTGQFLQAIANNGLDWANIPAPADGSITHPKLAADAVEADNIADGAVVAAALASSAVTGPKIASAAVGVSKLNVPSGATDGQVLTKTSGGMAFQDAAGGGGGTPATRAEIRAGTDNAKVITPLGNARQRENLIATFEAQFADWLPKVSVSNSNLATLATEAEIPLSTSGDSRTINPAGATHLAMVSNGVSNLPETIQHGLIFYNGGNTSDKWLYAQTNSTTFKFYKLVSNTWTAVSATSDELHYAYAALPLDNHYYPMAAGANVIDGPPPGAQLPLALGHRANSTGLRLIAWGWDGTNHILVTDQRKHRGAPGSDTWSGVSPYLSLLPRLRNQNESLAVPYSGQSATAAAAAYGFNSNWRAQSGTISEGAVGYGRNWTQRPNNTLDRVMMMIRVGDVRYAQFYNNNNVPSAELWKYASGSWSKLALDAAELLDDATTLQDGKGGVIKSTAPGGYATSPTFAVRLGDRIEYYRYVESNQTDGSFSYAWQTRGAVLEEIGRVTGSSNTLDTGKKFSDYERIMFQTLSTDDQDFLTLDAPFLTLGFTGATTQPRLRVHRGSQNYSYFSITGNTTFYWDGVGINYRLYGYRKFN